MLHFSSTLKHIAVRKSAATFRFFEKARSVGLSNLLSIFAVLIGGLVGATAHAADNNGKFAIRGAGLQTCEIAVNAFETASPDLSLYAGWIDGYITGLNQFREDTFEIAPWQTASTLLAMTVQVCRNQPEGTDFMRVFVSLLREFSSTRLQSESPLVGVFNGNRRLALYASTVAAVERVLDETGYDTGSVDGTFDEATAQALTQFQKDRGLELSGLPDQRTLFALFVGTAIESQGAD